MGLFKSREERKMERDIEIRKGIQTIRRNIKNLEHHEHEYIKKAQRAKQIGSVDQLSLIRSSLKRTAGQKRMLERQLLSIETALQIKNQAEAHAQFARSMNALSKAISMAFGSVDLVKTQKEFEKAMVKAESMEQRMEIFLDMSSDSLTSEGAGDELVSDEEIERMIDANIARDEGVDQEIEKELNDIEKELGKGE